MVGALVGRAYGPGPSDTRGVASDGLPLRLQDLPIRWFHATLDSPARIPGEGGALVVGNHAFGGLDGLVLGALIVRHTGRRPRFLADRNLFRIPGLPPALRAFGAVAGEPDAAVSLLRRGEIVVVYPGGVDEAFKPSAARHELRWGGRRGFAIVAMRAGVPIIPVAGIGIDDMVTVVARERWIGRRLFGKPRYDLPIALGALGLPIPVPRRSPQKYALQAPIDTSGDPTCEADVERVRAATQAAIEAALLGR